MSFRLRLLVVFCFSVHIFYAQSVSVDSVLSVIAKTKDSDKKTELYLFLSMEYEATDINTAFKYAQKALSEANKNKSETVLSEVYNNLANIYEYRSVSDSSFIFHKKALELRLKQNNLVKIGDSYNNIGIYYDRTGNFPESLENYFKALRCYEKENDEEKQAMVLSNIGIVYKAQKEYGKSLEYYKKAEELYSKVNSDFGIAVCQGNIGSVLLMLKEYEESIKYSERAKKSYEEMGYDRFVVYPLINTAIANDSLKDYPKAESLYIESVELYKKYQNNYEIANTLNAYAGCLLKQSKDKEGLFFLTQALDYAKQSNAALLEIAIRKNMAKAYYKMGNLDQAFKQMEIYAAGKDSLFEQEKTKAVFELEKQYQTEKKEKKILEQRAEIAENSLEIEQKNMQIVVALFLFLASALLGYMFFFKQKQKSNRLEKENLLKDAYAKLETQSQLHSQRLKISRDLHDNIGSQLTFIISSVENIKYYFKENNTELNKRIDSIGCFTKQTISELRDTIWAMNKGEISFEDLQARLSDFIANAARSVGNVSFNFDIDPAIKNNNHQFTSLEGINLYRVVQEAVNNAVKHSKADKINLNINPADDSKYKFDITVTDNGKGFSVSEKNSGNGLVNMQKRIEEANGKIEFLSNQKGTTIRIKL